MRRRKKRKIDWDWLPLWIVGFAYISLAMFIFCCWYVMANQPQQIPPPEQHFYPFFPWYIYL